MSEPPPSTTDPSGIDALVLLVEDEVSVRRVLSRVLRRSGYRVIEAEDGAMALELVRETEERIDLLLTDVLMPRMDGLQLSRRFQDLRPDVPIVFMSGYVDDGETRQAISRQSSNFLPKPFEPRQLLAVLERVLDRS